ncbi:peptidase S41 [Flavobacterium zepuense]|uniref:Peptidase S41 n=1 Tax=Flavobacterium zepuense TaxID=2593302 RepID=A0A552V9U1_9FLAO|nr:S41 family peptidase [Flavobacterium zepuense]TRW27235.1 peptidase S41 [Flavobacterium zepuense]
MVRIKNYIKIVSLILILTAYSCQNDDAPEVLNEGTDEFTNNWIYEQMQRYYYYNSSLPSRGDLKKLPQDYFLGLLHPQDRFSYAVNLNDASTYPQSLRNSFGFNISFIEHEGQVLGVVLYVLQDSPAQYAGLQRGQYINAINAVPVNHENYNNLYEELSASQNAQLTVMDYHENTGFSAPYVKNITKGTVLLQPVRGKIIQEQNHTVGYIQIPHFDVGLSQALLNAFLNFKSQGVDEVVVDLRYNGGGDVSSATALAILLAPNIQADQQFIRFTGNANGGVVNQSFTEALKTNETQVSFEALRSAHPSIGRVFILCSSHTASASEIIINNLRPFMQVITIGSKTMGKDVATFPIENDMASTDEEKWILYPAIYKISNANGEGNYAAGITPSIDLEELGELSIHPLGEPNEVLLSQSLAIITGTERINTGKNVMQTQKNIGSINDAEPIIMNNLSLR